MSSLRRRTARAAPFLRARGRCEGGFALLEVLIASVVVVTVLTGVGALFGTELVNIGASGAEQTANELLTRAMEQVRALPFQLIVDGLSPGDVGGDPNIEVTGTAPDQTYIFVPTGEVIPMSAPGPQVPLDPHISTTTLDGVTYKVATYPTIVSSYSGLYRVTVIVTWAPSHGVARLSAQTLVYSPASGCLTATNHPFAAPCQPFFYAQSGVTAGSGFTVSGSVAGLNLASISLLGPTVSSVIQMEQSTSALGNVQTSEGILNALGVTTYAGGESAATESDNDPATKSPPSETATTASQSNLSPLTVGSLLSTGFEVIPGLGDSGTSVSTVKATSSPACDDLKGQAQVTGAACSSNVVTQSGAAASLSAVLSAVGLPLVSVAPSTTSSFAADYPVSGYSYCTTTTGDGCVHAAAQRAIGTVMLAGLPSLLGLTFPAGWGLGNLLSGCPAGNYMVALVGYSDTATAESGVNAAAPTASVGSSGTLCYWNGSTYASIGLSLGLSPQVLSIPALTVGLPAVAAVTITPSLTLGTATTSQSTNSGCATACTASSTITSPVSGSLQVQVVVAGVTLANVTLGVDMGTVEARTSYQAAP